MIAWFAASHLVSALTGGGLLKLFFGNLLGDLKAVVAWLRRHSIWLTVSIALAAGWGVDHIISHRHAAKLETQLVKCTSARHADQVAYTNAQIAAQAKNDAQIVRVKKKQQEITDATVSNLDARLQLIRSELSKHSAPQSHPVGAQAGNPGSAPCIANDPAWMCLSPAQRLSAAESEERHDELIDWNFLQSKVDPNN